MTTITKPSWMLPLDATASNYLRVTFGDATTANVAFVAGAYYWRGNGGSDDLTAHIATRLNADAAGKGHTWTCTLSTAGRLEIVATGGSTGIASLRFLLASFTSVDAGFALTVGGPDTITPTTGQTFTGAYQVSRLWLPDRYAAEDRVEPQFSSRVHITPSGGVTQVSEGSWSRRRVRLERVDGDRLYTWAAERVAVTVTVGDVNAALDSFVTQYNAQVGDDGEPPAMEYHVDAATRSALAAIPVAFTDEDLLSDPAGSVEESELAPLRGTVTLEMVEV